MIVLSYDILTDLIINRVISTATIYSEKGSGGTRFCRECWAVIHKFEGETVYKIGGKNIISNRENMVILPKGCTYEWKCLKAGRFSVLEFECNLTYDEILYFSGINAEVIQKTMQKMETRNILKEKYYKLNNLNDTYSIITMLLKGVSRKYNSANKKEKIAPAVKFMAENLSQSPSNDVLAELCGISTVYFRKLFTEIYCDSPINYLHKLKIQKAKEMLKSDFGTISEIAITLGYSNLYDFSRVFKKHTGTSPKLFLNSYTNQKDRF